MSLEKFLSLDGEHSISPDEVKLLNEDLARISAQDVPVSHRAKVADYLISALNMNSVRHEITPALDLLLAELQACA